jgi:phosphoglycolate phosphatase-like HAD superfamily hydrolase
MIERAVRDLDLNLTGALVIGDKLADVKLGKNIGARTALVLTGYGKEEAERLKDVDSSNQPDYVADNLFEAVSLLARPDN